MKSTRIVEACENIYTLQGVSQATSAHVLSVKAIKEPSRCYLVFKRLLDIGLATTGVVMLMPVFLVIAISIKIDNRSAAIFYWREIIGMHGRRFYALKFRTMIPDADAYLIKRPELLEKYRQNMKLIDDPRITRIGKALRATSLDELPQLLNVIKGEMSLIGPRIIHPSELPRYAQYGRKRLSVKPGLSGLWQISGRQHISYDERVLLDMQYIDTRSTVRDIMILLKTFKVFIIHDGL